MAFHFQSTHRSKLPTHPPSTSKSYHPTSPPTTSVPLLNPHTPLPPSLVHTTPAAQKIQPPTSLLPHFPPFLTSTPLLPKFTHLLRLTSPPLPPPALPSTTLTPQAPHTQQSPPTPLPPLTTHRPQLLPPAHHRSSKKFAAYSLCRPAGKRKGMIRQKDSDIQNSPLALFPTYQWYLSVCNPCCRVRRKLQRLRCIVMWSCLSTQM